MAMPIGIRLGRTTEPKLAPIPICASGRPSLMPGAATRRSQASASSKPPATAAPFSAATIGTGVSVTTSKSVAAGPVHRRAEALAPLVGRADLLEVEPGAEGRPVPGEDDGPHAVRDAGEELLDQVGLERGRERVAALGPVEGEQAEVPAVLDDQSGLEPLRLAHAADHSPTATAPCSELAPATQSTSFRRAYRRERTAVVDGRGPEQRGAGDEEPHRPEVVGLAVAEADQQSRRSG